MSPRSKARPLFMLAATAAVSLGTIAHADQFSSLAPFLAAARGDIDLETFDGPTANDLEVFPFHTPLGYTYTIGPDSGIRWVFRNPSGTGAALHVPQTLIDFRGRPVTAVSARLSVLDQSAQDVGGQLTIVTDAGETFLLPVPVGGAFFGITSPQRINWIRINAPSGMYEAVDDLRVGVSAAIPAAANVCAEALTIGLGAYPFSNQTATTDGPTSLCQLIPTSRDVWYRLVAPASGPVTVSTCGCGFDSVLEVFTACSLVGPIACDDDGCAAGASSVTFAAAAGRPYMIRISGHDGATGSGMLRVTQTPDCAGDFNHSGAVSVQDLFDFMAAYFAPCP